MPTALTGQLGLPASKLGLVQLGGPATVQKFSATRPATAQAFMAHVFAPDGVTFVQSLGQLLNRPALTWKSNGSYDPITLELPAAPGAGAGRYGVSLYGTGTYGGGLVLGQIVRLTEQGGDGSWLYSGVIEALPETASPTGTSHHVDLKPLAFQLDDTVVSLRYTAPTDISQMVRDAVSATGNLHCDQVSVPAATGILAPTAGNAAIDFSLRPAKEVLDLARSIAGPGWFWFVDAGGRVWFQSMGSVAQYTVKLGTDYESRTSNGGSIADLRNDVPIVGGVPKGGTAPAFARYTGSVSIYGRRTLNPPLALPHVTDQPTLQAVAATVGAVLDRVWLRTQIKVLGTYTSRINMGQPGGAMLRYFEGNVQPMTQSGSGSGGYSGPFHVQSCTDDGLFQQVTVGDIPVTDTRDLGYMTTAALSRVVTNTLLYTPAALNVQGVVSQSGGLATAPDPGVGQPSAQRWVVDRQSIRGFDGTATDYGAPSGGGVGYEFTPDGRGFLGRGLTLQSSRTGARMVIDSTAARGTVIDPSGVTRFEWGNLAANGVSPAQWGARTNYSTGQPAIDGLGPISGGVMASLGLISSQSAATGLTNTAFALLSMPGSMSFSFSILNRASNVLCIFFATGQVTAGSGDLRVRTNLVGTAFSGNLKFGTAQHTNGYGHLWVVSLAPGSYTLQIEAQVDSGTTGTVDQAYQQSFLLGS